MLGRLLGLVHLFQSTHPVWGATFLLLTMCGVCCNFNPRTPCGVRPIICVVGFVRIAISIHAPRVGCDPEPQKLGLPPKAISIHAPRVGCDHDGSSVDRKRVEFQSTHPVWGATRMIYQHYKLGIFQSTHPVWGATFPDGTMQYMFSISIHAPRVGCD